MKYSMHMSALWTTTKLHLRQSFICHVLLSPFCLKQLILHQCCQLSEFEMYRWLSMMTRLFPEPRSRLLGRGRNLYTFAPVLSHSSVLAFISLDAATVVNIGLKITSSEQKLSVKIYFIKRAFITSVLSWIKWQVSKIIHSWACQNISPRFVFSAVN